MIKLHIGCGKRDFGEGWIHIDGNNYSHVRYHDIVNLPFKPNTVDLIYASHVIEYFDREEVIDLLNKWYKVLKIQGKIRIAVPDFEVMASLYTLADYDLNDFLGPLYGKWQIKDKYVYHKTVYDYTSLKNLLESIGFKKIEKYDWRVTEHSQFDDYSQAYIPHMNKENGILISLNVEAIK